MSATLRVSWTRDAQPGDDPFAVLTRIMTGVLTTDHAASSRGLPVLVGADGEVLGPAEVGELTVNTYVETDDVVGEDIHRRLNADEIALMGAAIIAGYKIDNAATHAATGDGFLGKQIADLTAQLEKEAARVGRKI